MVSKTASASDKSILSPQLADLLEGYHDEIVASWVTLLYGMEGSHYREQPVTDLQAATRTCIDALVGLFRSGSYDALAVHSREICERRVGQGFDIAEVIEGHFLLNEAVLPIIQRETQWNSYDDAALDMASVLDSALRWLVVRYAKLYSLALNARLKEQVMLLDNQRALLERRVREVTALVRSSALITQTLDLDELLTLVLEQLAEVVNYDRASIQLMFDGRLRIIAGKGFADVEQVLGLTFDPRDNTLARRLLNDAGPIVLGEVKNEPGFISDPDDPTRSWIGVPLSVRGEVFGALALDKKDADFYDEEDGQTVMAFANQAAIAIQNAKLYDRAREQEILQERNRLARELHDSLSQSLFSMVLNAEAANLFFDVNQEKAKAQINLLYETANAALKDMRTLIFELRPANLEEEGLATVLTKHAKLTAGRYGINIKVEVKGQRRLPLHIEKALFRVAQEALNNVVKHAGATEVQINLATYDNWVTMSIEDNGVGIAPGAVKPNTLGLTSMRERVEQLEGRFEIAPNTAGKGTIVRVKVPCDG